MIEYRKAQRTGNSEIGAITITLPISWVREQGISKGQLLKIVPKGDGLLITKASVE